MYDKWKFDFWHVRCLYYQVESILIHFLKLEKFSLQNFPGKTAKKVKILHRLKILKMWYLGHAEHHAKNRTSLCGLDQRTLFFDLPLISPQYAFICITMIFPHIFCALSWILLAGEDRRVIFGCYCLLFLGVYFDVFFFIIQIKPAAFLPETSPTPLLIYFYIISVVFSKCFL